eukprot:Sspe_Gene.10957::Locus_3700_Transcript_1_2_Confidence_0.667_Length_10397::g.10957::m.10957
MGESFFEAGQHVLLYTTNGEDWEAMLASCPRIFGKVRETDLNQRMSMVLENSYCKSKSIDTDDDEAEYTVMVVGIKWPLVTETIPTVARSKKHAVYSVVPENSMTQPKGSRVESTRSLKVSHIEVNGSTLAVEKVLNIGLVDDSSSLLRVAHHFSGEDAVRARFSGVFESGDTIKVMKDKLEALTRLRDACDFAPILSYHLAVRLLNPYDGQAKLYFNPSQSTKNRLEVRDDDDGMDVFMLNNGKLMYQYLFEGESENEEDFDQVTRIVYEDHEVSLWPIGYSVAVPEDQEKSVTSSLAQLAEAAKVSHNFKTERVNVQKEITTMVKETVFENERYKDYVNKPITDDDLTPLLLAIKLRLMFALEILLDLPATDITRGPNPVEFCLRSRGFAGRHNELWAIFKSHPDQAYELCQYLPVTAKERGSTMGSELENVFTMAIHEGEPRVCDFLLRMSKKEGMKVDLMSSRVAGSNVVAMTGEENDPDVAWVVMCHRPSRDMLVKSDPKARSPLEEAIHRLVQFSADSEGDGRRRKTKDREEAGDSIMASLCHKTMVGLTDLWTKLREQTGPDRSISTLSEKQVALLEIMGHCCSGACTDEAKKAVVDAVKNHPEIDYLSERVNSPCRGLTPLHLACNVGTAPDHVFYNKELIELLCEKMPWQALETDDDGWAPIHYTAAYEHEELTEKMFELWAETLGAEGSVDEDEDEPFAIPLHSVLNVPMVHQYRRGPNGNIRRIPMYTRHPLLMFGQWIKDSTILHIEACKGEQPDSEGFVRLVGHITRGSDIPVIVRYRFDDNKVFVHPVNEWLAPWPESVDENHESSADYRDLLVYKAEEAIASYSTAMCELSGYFDPFDGIIYEDNQIDNPVRWIPRPRHHKRKEKKSESAREKNVHGPYDTGSFETVAHWMASRNNVAILKRLTKAHETASLLWKQNSCGMVPAFTAFLHDNMEAFKFIVRTQRDQITLHALVKKCLESRPTGRPEVFYLMHQKNERMITNFLEMIEPSHGDDETHTGKVLCCATADYRNAWHPMIAYGGVNGVIRIWNPDLVSDGSVKRRWHLQAHPSDVLSVAWYPQRKGDDKKRRLLASGGKDGMLRMWDTEGMREARKAADLKHPVTSLAFGEPPPEHFRSNSGSEHGKQQDKLLPALAAGLENGTVVLCKPGDPVKVISDFSISKHRIVSLHWHPKYKNQLLVASADGKIQLWEVAENLESATKKCEMTLNRAGNVSGAQFHSLTEPHVVVFCDYVYLCDLSTGQIKASCYESAVAGTVLPQVKHSGLDDEEEEDSVDYELGPLVVVCVAAPENGVLLWDPTKSDDNEGEYSYGPTLEFSGCQCYPPAPHSNEKSFRIVTGSHDGTVSVWNIEPPSEKAMPVLMETQVQGCQEIDDVDDFLLDADITVNQTNKEFLEVYVPGPVPLRRSITRPTEPRPDRPRSLHPPPGVSVKDLTGPQGNKRPTPLAVQAQIHAFLNAISMGDDKLVKRFLEEHDSAQTRRVIKGNDRMVAQACCTGQLSTSLLLVERFKTPPHRAFYAAVRQNELDFARHLCRESESMPPDGFPLYNDFSIGGMPVTVSLYDAVEEPTHNDCNIQKLETLLRENMVNRDFISKTIRDCAEGSMTFYQPPGGRACVLLDMQKIHHQKTRGLDEDYTSIRRENIPQEFVDTISKGFITLASRGLFDLVVLSELNVSPSSLKEIDADGLEMPEAIEVVLRDSSIPSKRVRKTQPSSTGLDSEAFWKHLESANIRQLFLGGCIFDDTVIDTARSAVQHGYEVIIINDFNIIPPEAKTKCTNLKDMGVQFIDLATLQRQSVGHDLPCPPSVWQAVLDNPRTDYDELLSNNDARNLLLNSSEPFNFLTPKRSGELWLKVCRRVPQSPNPDASFIFGDVKVHAEEYPFLKYPLHFLMLRGEQEKKGKERYSKGNEPSLQLLTKVVGYLNTSKEYADEFIKRPLAQTDDFQFPSSCSIPNSVVLEMAKLHAPGWSTIVSSSEGDPFRIKLSQEDVMDLERMRFRPVEFAARLQQNETVRNMVGSGNGVVDAGFRKIRGQTHSSSGRFEEFEVEVKTDIWMCNPTGEFEHASAHDPPLLHLLLRDTIHYGSRNAMASWLVERQASPVVRDEDSIRHEGDLPEPYANAVFVGSQDDDMHEDTLSRSDEDIKRLKKMQDIINALLRSGEGQSRKIFARGQPRSHVVIISGKEEEENLHIGVGYDRCGVFKRTYWDSGGALDDGQMAWSLGDIGLVLIFQAEAVLTHLVTASFLNVVLDHNILVDSGHNFDSLNEAIKNSDAAVKIRHRHLFQATQGGHETVIFDRFLDLLMWACALDSRPLLNTLLNDMGGYIIRRDPYKKFKAYVNERKAIYKKTQVLGYSVIHQADNDSKTWIHVSELGYNCLHYALYIGNMDCTTTLLDTVLERPPEEGGGVRNGPLPHWRTGDNDYISVSELSSYANYRAEQSIHTFNCGMELLCEDIKWIYDRVQQGRADETLEACTLYSTDGVTPLHIAAEFCRPDGIAQLLTRMRSSPVIPNTKEDVDAHELTLAVRNKFHMMEKEGARHTRLEGEDEKPMCCGCCCPKKSNDDPSNSEATNIHAVKAKEAQQEKQTEVLEEMIELMHNEQPVSKKLRNFTSEYFWKVPLMYLIFVLLLTYFAFAITMDQVGSSGGDMVHSTYWATSAITDSLFEDPHFLVGPEVDTQGYNLRDVGNFEEIGMWIQGPWYRTFFDEREASHPFNSIYGTYYPVGAARVQQLRVKNDTGDACSPLPVPYNPHCYPGWDPDYANTTKHVDHIKVKSMDWADPDDHFQNTYFPSRITGSYWPTSEGIFIDISMQNETDRNMAFEAMEMGFFDQATRFVRFSFTLYNPNTDRFSFVEIFWETPKEGFIYGSERISTFRLSRYQNWRDWIRCAAEIIILLFMVYLTFQEVVDGYYFIISLCEQLHDLEVGLNQAVPPPLVQRIMSTQHDLKEDPVEDYYRSCDIPEDQLPAHVDDGRTLLGRMLGDRRKHTYWRIWCKSVFKGTRLVIGEFFSYLINDWQGADLLLLFLLWASVTYHFRMFVYEDDYMGQRMMAPLGDSRHDPDLQASYIDFDPLSSMHRNLRLWLSAALVVAWIKLLKNWTVLPGVGPVAASIVSTITDSKVMIFMFLFMNVMIALVVGAFVCLSGALEDYRTFHASLFTVFRLLLGDADFGSLEEGHYIMGPVLWVVGILFGNLVLLNILIAVVGEVYNEQLTGGQKFWNHVVGELYQESALNLPDPNRLHVFIHRSVSKYALMVVGENEFHWKPDWKKWAWQVVDTKSLTGASEEGAKAEAASHKIIAMYSNIANKQDLDKAIDAKLRPIRVKQDEILRHLNEGFEEAKFQSM